MKSTILSLLPLASLALAESVCHRNTVTLTEVEKVTVTVGANGEPMNTGDVDITSTSTYHTTTTITVRPSAAPSAMTSSLKWGQYSNATYHHSSGAALSTGAALKPSSVFPEFSLVVTPTPAAEDASTPQAEQVPSAEAPSSSTSETPETPSSPAPEAPAQEAGTSAAGSKRGKASFYGGNTDGGKCSFKGYTIPAGIFGTAISASNFANSDACGQCVSVTGPSGTKITAMITDVCPECETNKLDLYQDAFAKLAELEKGIIDVSWDFVPCGISSPIVLKNKEGTSKYWFSVQVMNANVGVSKVEVSVDGGKTWTAMVREEHNFFTNPAGFGKDTMDVRVTGVNGKSVIVKGVTVVEKALRTASGNL